MTHEAAKQDAIVKESAAPKVTPIKLASTPATRDKAAKKRMMMLRSSIIRELRDKLNNS